MYCNVSWLLRELVSLWFVARPGFPGKANSKLAHILYVECSGLSRDLVQHRGCKFVFCSSALPHIQQSLSNIPADFMVDLNLIYSVTCGFFYARNLTDQTHTPNTLSVVNQGSNIHVPRAILLVPSKGWGPSFLIRWYGVYQKL